MITKGKYILDKNGIPIEETDLLKWSKWIESHRTECSIARDQIGGSSENFVSTIFLGLDYSFSINPKNPILYETMIFGCGDRNNDTYRYATKEEALENHNFLVTELRKIKIA